MFLAPQQTTFCLEEHEALTSFLGSQVEPKILVFWSSRNSQTGQMWCPDCVQMEARLIDLPTKVSAKAFDSLVYVFVGERDEWISPANEFRNEPWKVERIPTVLKVAPKAQGALKDRISPRDARLVEDDAKDLEKLVKYLEDCP